MKKLLSIILAIAMIMSLVPATFATDGEASEGIRIKYDLLGAIKDLGVDWESSKTEADKAKRVSFKNISYDLTNGFFSFNSASTGEFTGHSELNYNSKYGFQISSGDWIALDIVVPKAGTYTMEMWCGNYSSDTKTKVYVDDKEVGVYSNYEEGTVASGATSGQNNIFTKVVDEPRYIEGITFETAGVHTVKFYGNSNYCSAGTFYLIENGTGTGTCLTAMVATIDKEALIYGADASAKFTVDGMYMSDGTAVEDISAYKVSFKSDNEKVATVDESGNISVVGLGSANIIAYTANEFGTELKVEREVAVVDGATIKYDLKKHIHTDLGYYQGKVTGSLEAVNEELTNGFYSYDPDSVNDFGDGDRVKYYASLQLGYVGTNVSFRINVPAAGYYNIMHDVVAISPSNANAERQNIDIQIYVSKDKISTSADNYIGSVNAYGENYTEGQQLQLRSGTAKFDEPGTYILTFKVGAYSGANTPFAQINSFYLVGGTKDALMNGSITSTAAEINVDEGETATVSATGYISSTAEATTAFTYSSSNKDIATVDATSGVVTPVAPGKVTITATAKDAEVANTLTTDITVTENLPGAEADETIKVYIPAVSGGTVTVTGATLDRVSDVEVGKTVTVEAVAAEGYKFAYWKDNAGGFVSEEAEYSFKPYTNTSLIAVFDSVSEEGKIIGVEFFDGNKAYLGFKEVAAGTKFEEVDKPAYGLMGFTFKGWSIGKDEEINSLVRAVALYNEQGNPVSGISINGTAKTANYDDAITETVAGAKAWYRDEKLVGYGDTYTYRAWSGTVITSSDVEPSEKAPLAVLNQSGDSYMLEYDKGEYEIVEAGILFGDDTHKEVSSCYYKAKVKTLKEHGQFTAKANAEGTAGLQTTVRGYVMFKDSSNNVRVVYSD